MSRESYLVVQTQPGRVDRPLRLSPTSLLQTAVSKGCAWRIQKTTTYVLKKKNSSNFKPLTTSHGHDNIANMTVVSEEWL